MPRHLGDSPDGMAEAPPSHARRGFARVRRRRRRLSASVPNAVTFAISDDAAQRAFPAELTSARGIGIGAARLRRLGGRGHASSRPTARSLGSRLLLGADRCGHGALCRCRPRHLDRLLAHARVGVGLVRCRRLATEGERSRRLRVRRREALSPGEGLHGLERAEPQDVREAQYDRGLRTERARCTPA